MPYLTEADQIRLDPMFGDATFGYAETPGELNYQLTQFCIKYIEKMGSKYRHYNDVIGALESCKLEFYRRMVAPYEDTKILENGDVYK